MPSPTVAPAQVSRLKELRRIATARARSARSLAGVPSGHDAGGAGPGASSGSVSARRSFVALGITMGGPGGGGASGRQRDISLMDVATGAVGARELSSMLSARASGAAGLGASGDASHRWLRGSLSSRSGSAAPSGRQRPATAAPDLAVTGAAAGGGKAGRGIVPRVSFAARALPEGLQPAAEEDEEGDDDEEALWPASLQGLQGGPPHAGSASTGAGAGKAQGAGAFQLPARLAVPGAEEGEEAAEGQGSDGEGEDGEGEPRVPLDPNGVPQDVSSPGSYADWFFSTATPMDWNTQYTAEPEGVTAPAYGRASASGKVGMVTARGVSEAEIHHMDRMFGLHPGSKGWGLHPLRSARLARSTPPGLLTARRPHTQAAMRSVTAAHVKAVTPRPAATAPAPALAASAFAGDGVAESAAVEQRRRATADSVRAAMGASAAAGGGHEGVLGVFGSEEEQLHHSPAGHVGRTPSPGAHSMGAGSAPGAQHAAAATSLAAAAAAAAAGRGPTGSGDVRPATAPVVPRLRLDLLHGGSGGGAAGGSGAAADAAPIQVFRGEAWGVDLEGGTGAGLALMVSLGACWLCLPDQHPLQHAWQPSLAVPCRLPDPVLLLYLTTGCPCRGACHLGPRGVQGARARQQQQHWQQGAWQRWPGGKACRWRWCRCSSCSSRR